METVNQQPEMEMSPEQLAEQKERMLNGLIPSMNDLGAWKAAQDTVDRYGRGVLDE